MLSCTSCYIRFSPLPKYVSECPKIYKGQNISSLKTLLELKEMKVEAGDYVLFHYVGRFEDGEVFDTSYEEIARENGILVDEREYGPMWAG